jgi:carbonic anhydrase
MGEAIQEHTGSKVLADLLEGNRRFRTGQSNLKTYEEHQLRELSIAQHPIAAVVTCCDSRVVPEVMFDQPLGSLFVSRVPGNVASDSAKWMIDIAVGEFHVPLLLVVGHSGCLAIGQIVQGMHSGPGGWLRQEVQRAVHKAQATNPGDLWTESIRVNARQTIEKLQAESSALGKAIAEGSILCKAAFYDMTDGSVKILE